MTYQMTLLNGYIVDINCPYCNGDKFRSQGPRKQRSYHMFQCTKCGKCHSRFLDTGNLVTIGKPKWKYMLHITKLDDLDTIYKMYEELTDKKLLGKTTPDEEDTLFQIRNKLDDKDLIESLSMQIEKYEDMLGGIKLLSTKLKDLEKQSLLDF